MTRRTDRETDDMCARVYDEIVSARSARELGNVFFAFPWVNQGGDWVEPTPLILAAIAKRVELGKLREEGVFPIDLSNVDDVEFQVNHRWMKKFRGVNCLVVEQFPRGSKIVTRVKVPSDYVRHGTLQSAMVSIPQFHLGMTWYWPTIDALEAICRTNNSSNEAGKR